MKELLQCQKRFLLTRTYDEKIDTLMYQCETGGKRHIIALDCTELTEDDIAANADYKALCSIKCQCCQDCKCQRLMY